MNVHEQSVRYLKLLSCLYIINLWIQPVLVFWLFTWCHCRFLKALHTLVSTLVLKVDLHMSLKMRSLSRHILAEYVVYHFPQLKNLTLNGYFLVLSFRNHSIFYSCYILYICVCCTKKRAKTMMCDIRKLLEACLTWSHGYGESHAENLLKSKDERCFMLPKCGSHMTGQGG